MNRDRSGPGTCSACFFDDDTGQAAWMKVEEFRDGDDLVLRAELPGIDPEKDVELTVTGDTLHVRAERHDHDEDKRAGGFRSEFRYGSFERAFTLPAAVDTLSITATYNDGILTIRVPIPLEKEASRIMTGTQTTTPLGVIDGGPCRSTPAH